jgi:tRNAThr (cytosine32-N3)-methyltransferase
VLAPTIAIKLLYHPKNNPAYNAPKCGFINASVWDVSADSLPEDLEPGTVDVAVLIFVLSALHPDEWRQAILNIHRVRFTQAYVLYIDLGV